MDFAPKIRQYYLDNFSYLSLDKQFHFAGRLSSWNDDKDCIEIVAKLKDTLTSDEDPALKLKKLLEKGPSSGISAAELRQPYFDKYPDLPGRSLALFHVRHMKDVYGIDISGHLLQLVPYQSLRQLAEEIYKDGSAVRILSTYAINYFYLIDRILFPSETGFLEPAYFLTLAEGYDLTNPEELRLLIYLYTHCIIADSNFYARPIPEADKQTYTTMLERLEALLDKHFRSASLDTKLEFLVCAKICDFKTPLAERIYQECERSISPDGFFLVDTENDFADISTKKTFEASEHRNVLYIMSTISFNKNS